MNKSPQDWNGPLQLNPGDCVCNKDEATGDFNALDNEVPQPPALQGHPALHDPVRASLALAWPASPDQDEGSPWVTVDQARSPCLASGPSPRLLVS